MNPFQRNNIPVQYQRTSRCRKQGCCFALLGTIARDLRTILPLAPLIRLLGFRVDFRLLISGFLACEPDSRLRVSKIPVKATSHYLSDTPKAATLCPFAGSHRSRCSKCRSVCRVDRGWGLQRWLRALLRSAFQFPCLGVAVRGCRSAK